METHILCRCILLVHDSFYIRENTNSLYSRKNRGFLLHLHTGGGHAKSFQYLASGGDSYYTSTLEVGMQNPSNIWLVEGIPTTPPHWRWVCKILPISGEWQEFLLHLHTGGGYAKSFQYLASGGDSYYTSILEVGVQNPSNIWRVEGIPTTPPHWRWVCKILPISGE